MANKKMTCPRGHGRMELKTIERVTNFRGVDVTYETDVYVCSECGLEAATVAQAGETQRAISAAYRKKMNLLTGEEIKNLRKQRGLNQQELANLLKVGVASIKRWETGLIQSKSMDQALRVHLQGDDFTNFFSGNRELSIPRIKLVVREFERRLGRKLLKKTDKMLFAAKYLWYADMLAFRDLGKSMTGAEYAALPYGPQLNNYRDLIDEIKKADERSAEWLTKEEIGVIQKIIKAFPSDQKVYDAAHREAVFQNASVGAKIPYKAAYEFTELREER
jgi:putative zinc finger/helix-turn-helix YgiT family protein